MRRIIRTALLFITVTASSSYVAAAPPDCVFEHYSSLDGLPHNSISDIYKDSKGFIWICTWYGISRFDGHTFKNYRTLPGDYSPLSHNRFLRIREDAAGYLWITSYDNKLYMFNRHNETFADIPGVFPEFSGKDYKIDRFINSSDGSTWISLSGRGLIMTSTPGVQGYPSLVNYSDNPHVGLRIRKMFEYSKGRILVVSEKGLTLFSPDSSSPTGHIVSLVSRNDQIDQITEAGGTVYCGAGNQLLTFNGSGRITGESTLPHGSVITALEASPDGRTMYIGTSDAGVLKYDIEKGSFIAGRRDTGRIRSLNADSNGTLWITTAKPGITRYDPTRDDYKQFTQPKNTVPYYIDTLTRIVEARDRVWIKMNEVGFGYYDRDRDVIEPFFNSPGERFTNGVPSFFIDDTNILWMSTSERGLEKVTIIDQKAEVFTPSGKTTNSASSEIRALLNDSRGNLWVATKSDELFCYGHDMKVRHIFPDRNSGRIGMAYAIKEDSRGNIWLGTKGDGAVRMMPMPDGGYSFRRFRHDPTDRYSLVNDQIYSIEEDGSGRIWFGTYGGGICMLQSPDSQRFVTPLNNLPEYPMQQGEKVRYLKYASDGKMLVATVEGLIIFDPEQNPEDISFRLVQKIPGDGSSLGNNDIIHILGDSRGRLWLSTFGGGLNLLTEYDPDGEPRFDVLSSRHGLSSNIVFAATEDNDGNIWVSTENGISRFDPTSRTFSNFSRYDGIPPASFSEATAVTMPDGRVLFGSTGNLYVINPAEIEPENEMSGLTFTNLEIDNAEVEIGKKSPLHTSIVEAGEVMIPHDYSVFRLEFAALNYRLEPKLDYMYKLEGFDNEWNMARGSRSVSYSHVPHGKYKFRVRALAEGHWREGDEAALTIIVSTPPWKSWWAYLLYAAAIIIIVWLGLRVLYTMLSLRNNVKLEREMSDLKLRFFTNISHELRTPLTLILGGVEDVRKRETLSQRGEYNISLAEKNSKRMLTLINQLLDFRKIVNDKMELKVRHVDIVKIAKGVFDDFREMASERNIDLLFAVSHPSLNVWVDPQRMESVIYNLLSNAFKFTPSGGRIELSVSYREGEEEFTISVSDTGIGIPKEKIQAVFERFVQASSSVDSRSHGSGIGLSLSKDIVELHHGRITVESTVGKGSVFIVNMPVGNAHFSMSQIDFADGDKVYLEKSEYMTVTTGETVLVHNDNKAPEGAPKILLVEDNRELRLFIYNNLSDSYHVTEAENGIDALEKIRQDAPDIIITDLMMDGMDGIELTEKVRDDFSTSHIPIIMLTAKNEPDVRTKAMRYGADGYITKPFSMELLLARIDNLLTQRRKLFEKYSSQRARVVDLSPTEIVVTDRDEEFIRNVMSWIDANIENSELTIEQLATHLGMGRTSMYNKIKGLTGKSPVEIIKEYRVTKGRMLLASGQFSVSETAYRVGFSDPGYFSKCFKEQYKESPAEFVKKNPRKQTE